MVAINKYWFTIGVFILLFKLSFEQSNYRLIINYDQASRDILKLKTKDKLIDSTAVITEINNLQTQLQSIGYIESTIDSNVWNKNTDNVYLSLGKRYLWKNINKGKVDWTNLPNINYRYRDFNQRKFNFQELIKLEEAIIVSLENSGYPFASIYLDSIKIQDNMISANLEIDKGALIKIDTIVLDQFKDIRLDFLQQTISIFIGEEYNEANIKKIDRHLNRLSFANVSSASEIEFIDNKAKLILHLQKQNSNQFDGIIGFQPAANPKDKMLITGQLNLKLDNILKHGESMHLKWESPGNLSQNLNLHLQYPFLFSSPFGVAFAFKLNKRDTSFLNVNATPSIVFTWNASNNIRTYGNFFSSKSLGASTDFSYKKGIAEFNYNALGIAVNFNHLDYPFNPLKGYKISLQADAGTKTITNFSNLSSTIQDSTSKKEYKLTAELEMAFYIPFGQRSTVLYANHSASTNSQQLFTNELYRIGGFAKMRGFDEQSIFANLYSINTIEYHFLLNKNSFLGPFYDISYIENKIHNSINGIYQSFGLSFSFATQAGVFKLAYAIGKYPKQSFIFKQAKIHFGYTAVF